MASVLALLVDRATWGLFGSGLVLRLLLGLRLDVLGGLLGSGSLVLTDLRSGKGLGLEKKMGNAIN